MIYAKRIDNNQKDIVEQFREQGFSVSISSGVGLGYPDLTIGGKGVTIIGDVDKETRKFLADKNFTVIENITLMVEVKSKNGKLTPSQKKWLEKWKGNFLIVRSKKEVEEL